MTGRDAGETHRVATPLELLFDLTFVVAVGTAAHQFAEMLAEGHAAPAVLAFLYTMLAISIAWISFSWFASAFGTDDWLYRALTMVRPGTGRTTGPAATAGPAVSRGAGHFSR
ncbi:low temperature requirement protein A [Streptomyces rubiginosohelvolus]|uniref:low temperature requirement protein A n=1 Tax=Streptomyces rubiginosohelvolus TaxID=67362 RepID=UPI0038309FF5